MPFITQKIKGKNVKFLNVDATAGDVAELQAILAGEVSTFDKKSEGGSVAPYPLALNRKKFSCGNKSLKLSCSFTVPHMKESVYTPAVEAVVIGAFDASFESTAKATHTSLLYDAK
ncbi:MAG: hypothetical protein Q7S59_05855 [Sulfurimonas sp.]|nr:hypothetical protein [Sulfurimonas sp.]